MNKCLWCKKETKNKKYCCSECVLKHRRSAHPSRKGKYFVCKYCGEEFYRQKSSIKRSKYCSRECYINMRKDNPEACSNYGNFKGKNITCKNCNREFFARDCEINNGKQFCCFNCYQSYILRHPESASNYKGGKLKTCIYCGKGFWSVPSRKSHIYCSMECYMKDPNSPNRQYGEDNPMAIAENRMKVKAGIARHIKKHGKCWIGKNETIILDGVEKENNIKIERHHVVDGYIVDGYCKKHNIVFEVDEPYHKYYKEYDKKREEYIKEKLGCRVIRINDYGDGKYDSVSVRA